jgi:hypothetical protein
MATIWNSSAYLIVPGSVVRTSSQPMLWASKIKRYPETRSMSLDAVALNQAAALTSPSGARSSG